MLLLLLASIYAVLLPLGFGIWLVRLLRASLGLTDTAAPGALTVWLGGLLLLTVLLEAASLVIPVHTAAHLGAVAVAATGLWQPAGRQLLRQQVQQLRQWPWFTQLLAGLLLVYILFIGTMPSANLDTGIYHAQSMRWLEEVGVLPGLANVDVHIGFNSAWFVPEALFSWGRYLGSPLQVLNAVFFILFSWYCLSGINRLLRRQTAPADLVCLLLLVCLFRLLSDVASLSPDPGVVLLLFFIFLQLLRLPAPRPGQPITTPQAMVILLCVFALTVKLSTIPILLLPAWWLARSGQWRQGRWVGVLGALSLLVVAPWLTRNVLLSGYLVFPVALDLFNVSWKFPLAELRLHSEYIQEFARNKDFYGQLKVLHTPLQHWVPIWWREQHADSKGLLISILLLLAVSPLRGWRLYQRGRLPGAPLLAVGVGIALAGCLFWFVLAPALRFGHGFLFSLLALLLVPWLWPLAHYPRLLVAATTLAVLVLMVITPLQVHYNHYFIPTALSQREYKQLLQRLPGSASQNLVRSHYTRASADSVWATNQRPGLARLRFVLLVARAGGIPGRSGLDGSGHSGFSDLSQRLLSPAPYPLIPVQPLYLGAIPMLQNKQGVLPWYAPFPFVNRRKLCQANGPRLRDGFRPRLVPGIKNWRQEAGW